MSSRPAGAGDASGESGRKKSLLLEYIEKKVCLITNDGRNLIGTLLGFDQVCNVILNKSIERVFSADAGVQIVELGLYVVRGDNIAVLGEIDAERDSKVPWDKTKVCARCFPEHVLRPPESASQQTKAAVLTFFIIVSIRVWALGEMQGDRLKPVVH